MQAVVNFLSLPFFITCPQTCNVPNTHSSPRLLRSQHFHLRCWVALEEGRNPKRFGFFGVKPVARNRSSGGTDQASASSTDALRRPQCFEPHAPDGLVRSGGEGAGAEVESFVNGYAVLIPLETCDFEGSAASLWLLGWKALTLTTSLILLQGRSSRIHAFW